MRLPAMNIAILKKFLTSVLYMNQELKNNAAGTPGKSFYFKTISRIAFIFFIGFSVFLFFATLILIFLTKPEGEVEIPNVIGKRYIEINNTLIRKELRPSISFRDVYEIENGIVLEQHPDPGSVVSTGSKIRLVISRCNLFVEVPNVSGLELPFALNKLKNQHIQERSISLPVGVISYMPSDTVAENVVIDQSPKPGEKITLERKVNLLVSSGKTDDKMEMPDLTGQSIELGFSLLAAKGAYVRQNIVNVASIEQSGLIGSQTPPKGSKINKGDTVTLSVNYYKINEHPYRAYEIINYTIPADEKSGVYEAFVEDTISKRPSFLAPMSPGQTISFVFHRTGNARVNILSEKRSIKVFKFNVE